MEKAGKTFLLATDGSEASLIAFNTMIEEFITKKDKVVVVTITDASKTYLQDRY